MPRAARCSKILPDRAAPALAIALALAAAQFASSAIAQEETEEDAAPWAESAVVLPVFPGDADLIEFGLDRPTANRYYIDPRSIWVAPEGVVRYALVIVSSGGARNLSYEGLRCETRERRLYATGRADGTWARARRSDWLPLSHDGPSRYQLILDRRYLCPNRIAVRSAEEGIRALRSGGHPDVKIDQTN
jgi:hypothetical protein